MNGAIAAAALRSVACFGCVFCDFLLRQSNGGIIGVTDVDESGALRALYDPCGDCNNGVGW